jgi:hypothetical protein
MFVEWPVVFVMPVLFHGPMVVVVVPVRGPMVVVVVPMPGSITVVVAVTQAIPVLMIMGPVTVFDAMVFAVLFPVMSTCPIPMIMVMNFLLDVALVMFSMVSVFSAVRPGSGGKYQQQDSRQDTYHTYFCSHWTTSFVFEVVWIDAHRR